MEECTLRSLFLGYSWLEPMTIAAGKSPSCAVLLPLYERNSTALHCTAYIIAVLTWMQSAS
jgi:hypothetical protein